MCYKEQSGELTGPACMFEAIQALNCPGSSIKFQVLFKQPPRLSFLMYLQVTPWNGAKHLTGFGQINAAVTGLTGCPPCLVTRFQISLLATVTIHFPVVTSLLPFFVSFISPCFPSVGLIRVRKEMSGAMALHESRSGDLHKNANSTMVALLGVGGMDGRTS